MQPNRAPLVRKIMRDEGQQDDFFMRRCLALARQAGPLGELPFAAVLVREGKIVCEALNEVGRKRDLTRHAELIAISQGLRALERKTLSGCALYASAEPCAMCAFAIREARIDRVVYALGSPLMGGASRWNILGDEGLAAIPEIFGRTPPPRVIAGVGAAEAVAVWRENHPLAWQVISARGAFVCAPHSASATGKERRISRIREVWRYLRPARSAAANGQPAE